MDSPADLLNLEAIEQLRAAVGASAFGEIVGLFQADSTDLVRQLCAAVEAGDARAVASRAHRLSSSCATVGARALAGVCRQLETQARTGDLDGAVELSRLLQNLYAASVAALDKERG